MSAQKKMAQDGEKRLDTLWSGSPVEKTLQHKQDRHGNIVVIEKIELEDAKQMDMVDMKADCNTMPIGRYRECNSGDGTDKTTNTCPRVVEQLVFCRYNQIREFACGTT